MNRRLSRTWTSSKLGRNSIGRKQARALVRPDSGAYPDLVGQLGDHMTEQKPEIWSAGSFSQPWLRDAYSESKLEGPDHRRHEVVFAVCLVETYLFEWVRD